MYDFTASVGAQTPPYGSSAPIGSHITRTLVVCTTSARDQILISSTTCRLLYICMKWQTNQRENTQSISSYQTLLSIQHKLIIKIEPFLTKNTEMTCQKWADWECSFIVWQQQGVFKVTINVNAILNINRRHQRPQSTIWGTIISVCMIYLTLSVYLLQFEVSLWNNCVG